MKQTRPTLNIDDIVLLKSNPKEYLEKELEKLDIIEEDIVKHPVTERARNIGKTGEKGPIYEEDGEHYYNMTYKDGTKIKYKITSYGQWKTEITRQTVHVSDPDGYVNPDETHPIANQDQYEFLIDTQYEELAGSGYSIVDDPIPSGDGYDIPIGTYEYIPTGTEKVETIAGITTSDGEEIDFMDRHNDYVGKSGSEREKMTEKDYESYWIVCQAITDTKIDRDGNEYQRNITKMVNEILADGKDPKETHEKYFGNEGTTASEFAAEKFGEIVKNNQMPQDLPSYITVRSYGRKELAKDDSIEKGIITNKEITVGYINNYETDKKRREKPGIWSIITLHEKGNPARRGTTGGGGTYFTAPGQKTERLLIDEKTKTIIERDYQPGMDRHIWG